ncbi:MAG TPA: hypothetical protein VE029_07885, partial [Rhizobacter sp.]|nr:hypothetical protein [Rhizobacter sp.]
MNSTPRHAGPPDLRHLLGGSGPPSRLLRRAASGRVRALLPAAALLVVAPGAWGQSSGCDQFKDKLAARIDPGIRGFTLDIVPA